MKSRYGSVRTAASGLTQPTVTTKHIQILILQQNQ